MKAFSFWLGDAKLSALNHKCIESWPMFSVVHEGCPNLYEWKQGLNLEPYIRSAHEKKHWAAMTDLYRLIVLFEQGGLYMDVDVEIVKTEAMSDLVAQAHKDRKLLCGYEYGMSGAICNAVLAAPPRHPIVYDALKSYEGLVVGQTVYNGTVSGPTLLTNAVMRNWDKAMITSSEVFYPWGWKDHEKNDPDRRKKIVGATVAVHHWDGSWVKK